MSDIVIDHADLRSVLHPLVRLVGAAEQGDNENAGFLADLVQQDGRLRDLWELLTDVQNAR